VLVVSHDRYFMDKIVDHLLVFEGDANVRDFPGNYSQYREWKDVQDSEERQKKQIAKTDSRIPVTAGEPKIDRPRKLSFKEQKEFENLETDIEKLEAEKAVIETALSSGTCTGVEIEQHSIRFSELNGLIDEKTMRWMELSEISG